MPFPGKSWRRSAAFSQAHYEEVVAAGMAVDGEDDAAVVDEHVVDLRRSGRRAGWGRRHEVRDLARFVRIPYVVGPDTGVEESAEHYVLRAPGAAPRRILVHVVGAAAPASMEKGLDPGYRQRGDADR